MQIRPILSLKSRPNGKILKNQQEMLMEVKTFYSTHPLIRMLLNSNFHYFIIFKSLEFALKNSYVLCCLIRTPIIRTFCQFERV